MHVIVHVRVHVHIHVLTQYRQWRYLYVVTLVIACTVHVAKLIVSCDCGSHMPCILLLMCCTHMGITRR